VLRLVVVGGDAAGMSAASRARRMPGPEELDVLAFECGRYTSYSACGLPFLVAGHFDDVNVLVARSPEEFPGVVGTAITRVCAYEIGRTGLTEREAADAGFDAVGTRIESTTRAHYFRGAQPITVKVVAERSSGRLLGAQIIGREGAAKRIDVLATALWNEMTVDEIEQLDLGYAPPFSPVWDPSLVAARKAADACEFSFPPDG
jgi:NADPH-dependent 2,4-dienoyl-CoA reductase/sulfur reductase-like enzyme